MRFTLGRIRRLSRREAGTKAARRLKVRILLTADPELPVPPSLYGGIERIVDALVTELAASGFEIGLVAHRDSTAAAKVLYPWPAFKSQRKLDSRRNTAALWRSARDLK